MTYAESKARELASIASSGPAAYPPGTLRSIEALIREVLADAANALPIGGVADTAFRAWCQREIRALADRPVPTPPPKEPRE